MINRQVGLLFVTGADLGMKAIDLFAGPGGLSLGLMEAGFDIIGAIEIDAAAGETYRHNIGEHTLQADITKHGPGDFRAYLEENRLLGPDERPTLVAGGPPCPGFSLIGRSKISDLIRKGEYGDSKEYRHRFIDDPRNELFREFVKYVDEFQPDYFVMENVSGMTSYQIDEDPIVEVIRGAFSGYKVDWRILNAADFGVPQNRRRIIFLGHRQGVNPPEFPSPSHAGSMVRDAASAISDLSPIEPTDDGEGTVSCHWTRQTNERDKVLFPFIRSGAPAGKRGALEIPDSRPRQVYGDVFPSKWNKELVPAFRRAGMSAWKRDGRCHVRGTSGKRWLMYGSRGFADKLRRIRWDRPAPTIVAHLSKDGYMFIHPWKDRTITVREAARFQSFPDSFEFRGSMTAQFRQVGNAVPPLLAEALGRAIAEAINQRST